MEKEKRKRSPDERKRKSRTSDDDEDVRRSKKSSKDRDRDSKDKSKHKKHKSSGSKEKSRDKHKGSSHKHTTRLPPPQEISDADYFEKSPEFATWLKEEKHLFFSDLSSETARSLFSSFVKRWNANKLDPRYYEGISKAPRTSHKWNIKKDEEV